MSEGRTYRAGIIGLGFIGAGDQVSGDAIGQQVANLDGTHAQALGRHKRVTVVAGSSRDAGRSQRFAQRTCSKTYADWREMADREQLDIVSVATYSPVHAEMVIGCAERGIKAIYCEKPIATTVADAAEMVAACEKAGALLVINHNRRFNSNYRRLRDFIAAGKLGELTSASLRWGSGRLGNVGTHMIDALCLITSRAPAAVAGRLDHSFKPDCRGPEFRDFGGFGWMRMNDGLMVSVDAANHGLGRPQITVYGTKGRAITGIEEVRLEFWDGQEETWPSARGKHSSMDIAVGEIVAALDGDGDAPATAHEAVRTLEAIVAFHVSHDRDGGWIDLPLTAADRTRELLTA